MSKRILVTGIGGNVGQGILRNIISIDPKIILIGTNTNAISAGNHLCDRTYTVPFSKQRSYIPKIINICQKEKIDLIIPSTDYESYYLAVHRGELPVVACSPARETEIFLNKWKTAKSFSEKSIIFAETLLPKDYKSDFKEYIIKPAEGRGSREIYINPPDPKRFSDDYILQCLYKGQEITVSFYVKKNGQLLGFITLIRSLDNGMTDQCEVSFDYDKEVEKLINKIINNFKIRGSCNLQAIVTKKGRIVPFELNCRISGTNSVRANFGFEDVRYTLEEYLYDKTPRKPKIQQGAAIRIAMDIIYPHAKLRDAKDKKTEHYLF